MLAIRALAGTALAGAMVGNLPVRSDNEFMEAKAVRKTNRPGMNPCTSLTHNTCWRNI